ncbi:hypothetical protein XpCFBP7293_01095 [Xanthomonas perforans]|nr:hypothetical protein XpCFBP7293_01095 [Xanthomonas perforans]
MQPCRCQAQPAAGSGLSPLRRAIAARRDADAACKPQIGTLALPHEGSAACNDDVHTAGGEQRSS